MIITSLLPSSLSLPLSRPSPDIINFVDLSVNMPIVFLFFPLRIPFVPKWRHSCYQNSTTWVSSQPTPSSATSTTNSPSLHFADAVSPSSCACPKWQRPSVQCVHVCPQRAITHARSGRQIYRAGTRSCRSRYHNRSSIPRDTVRFHLDTLQPSSYHSRKTYGRLCHLGRHVQAKEDHHELQ